MTDPVSVGDVDAVFNRALQKQIIDYQLTEDGLHIKLEDGSYLVFFGSFAIAAVPPSEGYQ